MSALVAAQHVRTPFSTACVKVKFYHIFAFLARFFRKTDSSPREKTDSPPRFKQGMTGVT